MVQSLLQVIRVEPLRLARPPQQGEDHPGPVERLVDRLGLRRERLPDLPPQRPTDSARQAGIVDGGEHVVKSRAGGDEGADGRERRAAGAAVAWQRRGLAAGPAGGSCAASGRPAPSTNRPNACAESTTRARPAAARSGRSQPARCSAVVTTQQLRAGPARRRADAGAAESGEVVEDGDGVGDVGGRVGAVPCVVFEGGVFEQGGDGGLGLVEGVLQEPRPAVVAVDAAAALGPDEAPAGAGLDGQVDARAQQLAACRKTTGRPSPQVLPGAPRRRRARSGHRIARARRRRAAAHAEAPSPRRRREVNEVLSNPEMSLKRGT